MSYRDRGIRLAICVLLVPTAIASQNPKGWPVAKVDNGYSDYLKVAAAMHDKVVESISVTPKGSDPMIGARKRRDHLKAWLPTIEAGNRKKVFDPRARITLATLFPELYLLKRIAKWIPDAVDAEYADNHPEEAFRWLIAGTTYASKFPQRNDIELLIGDAAASFVGKSIFKHRQKLNADQLTSLISELGGTLRDPLTFYRVTRAEGSQLIGLIEEMRTDPSVLGLRPGDDLHAITEFLRGSVDDVITLETGYREMFNSRAELFRQPERTWASPPVKGEIGNPIAAHTAYWGDHLSASKFKGIMKLVAIIDSLLFAPTIEGVGEDWIRNRTDIRLLRVHLLVERFQRQHHRLPLSLSELGEPSITVDPLTGRPFLFDVDRRTNAVTIGSEGVKATGHIKIFAKRPTRY